MLAETHLSIWVSAPSALILALLAAIQLVRPVRPGTPPSRTRIRRFSMLIRIVLLVPVVVGLSVADPVTTPLRYVWSWAAAMLLLALSLMVTAVDIFNTLRVRAEAERALALETLALTMAPLLSPDAPDEGKG